MTLQADGSSVSRRGLLYAAGAVALAGASSSAVAAAGARGRRTVGLSSSPVLHTIRRLTFGPTPELVARVRDKGVEAWLDEQLRPELIPDPEVDRILAAFPVVHAPSEVVRAAYGSRKPQAINEVQVAALVRAVWSERQVLEVLTDFWSQHFNTSVNHDLVWFAKATEDREVIRRHALGRFSDLLVASAKSTTMLGYLDNWVSDRRNPNENYARELLELHTVGVQGGYTERDIKDAARVLTGWTLDSSYTFTYRPDRHHVGPVRVMGWTHRNADPAQGHAVGLSLLTYLARHPNTARYLATKLVRRLVSDEPPADLVASAAKVYLANDTAIAPVVRHIALSGRFRRSVGMKYRRPFELMAASMRALQMRWDPGTADQGATLIYLLKQLGNPPYQWRTPDGYPDTAQEWLSTAGTLARWNMHQVLATQDVPGVSPSVYDQVPSSPMSAGRLVDTLGRRLLQQELPAYERDALLRWVGRSEHDPLTTTEIKALTPQLSALVLDTAVHQLR